jgi:PPK2 family polyphosphate:nucleotide phosphotransferase
MGKTVRETFRAPADLDRVDTRARPVGPRDKAGAAEEMADLGKRLDHLQEALYAEATGGSPRAVLLVLQGMDTSGKGGVIRHVGGLVNPQGLQIATFKKPTEEELAHDFLWRIHKVVPPKGYVGIFNRSHYEDVLIVRVHDLVPRSVWSQRYEQINAFERTLSDAGVTILKFYLHISKAEQRKRLEQRFHDPTKLWKVDLADLDERKKWEDYMAAYEDALSKCSTKWAPWRVIPADRKWFRNLAISQIIVETMEQMKLEYPRPSFDPDRIVVSD